MTARLNSSTIQTMDAGQECLVFGFLPLTRYPPSLQLAICGGGFVGAMMATPLPRGPRH